MQPRLMDRSTGDLLVLMVAGTICFTVIASGASIIVVELIHPEQDTTAASKSIVGIVNLLIGILAGFLAGKTGSTLAEKKEP